MADEEKTKYPLHEAVEAKQVKLVRRLIKTGYNVNELDFRGRTPLHLVATRPIAPYTCHSNGQCVKFVPMDEEEAQCRVRIANRLIKAGANVNSLSIADAQLMKLINFLKFTTALQQAALCQNDVIVKVLLQNGADVNAKSDYTGNTALHWAMTNFRGNMNLVKHLLEHGGDVKATNRWRNTPLNLAAKNSTGCSVKLIELLLEHGADVNAKDGAGNTALHSVVTHFRVNSNLVKILLERGGHADAANRSGDTPLYLAIKHPVGHSVKLIELFLDRRAGKFNCYHNATPLHCAITHFNGNTKLVKHLLEHGSDANAFNHLGETPLHLAAQLTTRCSIKVIKLLLAHGADVDRRDRGKGFNASQFYIAAHQPSSVNPTMLKLLLLGNNNRAENRISPLHYACLFHQVDSVRKLLREGVDPSVRDRFGRVPMFYALISHQPGKEYHKSATIKLIIDFGAELDQRCIFPEIGRDGILPTTAHGLEILDMFIEYAIKRLVLHNGIDVRTLQKFIITQRERQRSPCSGGFPLDTLRWYARRKLLISSNYGYVQELRSMRETKIGQSEISFLDMLEAGPEKSAAFAKNKQLVEDFHAGKSKFAAYLGMLEASFYKGYARMKLVSTAAEALSVILCCDNSLEMYFRKYLSSHSDEELNCIIDE